MTEATVKKTRTRKASASTKTTTRKKTSLELPANPLMFEILHLVSSQRSKAKKIEVLKKV